ncbi:gfo/Idh/MocA family oxidoreductase [candidate division KSB3 bacterium]|uniref:Gfo/Idh/MocA family oxidoreductase n=1 Tax=candidate division KSB3 bacterium TaxID=2044937 RepID=A0A9D5JZS2_9BACT|nr:gfo/Idh/MocA family oxidoreductase [candidate division KSB3 bacterium]MBD3326976.1 gfo/Idh/MocA family oxidoreductase [candidate division KSB3 bacterium]
MIKVGVIGTGYIGPVHIEALSRISGIQVKAVTDANPELARKAAEAHNIDHVYQDYMELLNDPEIEVIHNCTPNLLHYIITKAAIEAGKHILSEKPLAMTLQEAGELVELADKKGIVTGIDFCYRYYPVVQEMAVRVRRGEAGNVRMATGTYFQDWLFFPTDYTWRLETAESGESNITADLGSHWFDLIQFVTGLHVNEVIADFATLIPVRKKPAKQVLAFEEVKEAEAVDINIDVEDYSAILFRLSNGAPGSFTTCQLCAGRKSDTEFQIYGDTCSFAWNHKRATELWIGYREKPNATLIESPTALDPTTAGYATLPGGHPLGYKDAVLNLFKDFYGVIKGHGEPATGLPRPTFATGYEEMKILQAILESVKARKWVQIVE